MVDDRLATIEGTSTADGATESLTYQDNESHTIEKMQVIEEGGGTLGATTGTVTIGGDSITDQNVPLSAFQGDYVDLFTLDVSLPANTEFELSYTNASGGSVTVNVVLYFSDFTAET
jgi:hypothetical protein